MPPTYEIRADYDRDTIVVYQAYSKAIATAALASGTFAPPFSFGRMTWIKPSFLWMMERSNWGQKSGQEYVLAIRIKRSGWEEALSQAVLTHPERGVYRDADDWRRQFESAVVHVQWDPERTLRGESLDYKSIQVGISRHVIERYVQEWIVEITDCTPVVRKIHRLLQDGHSSKAKPLLPKERSYPVSETISQRLGMKLR
ncbi:hypothetical protein CCAX7_29570 [Capsulimonas corticalis]|uniref:Uncharacterized protein n=1 Tax=Capsulimonas corticalis TaxID=2219043 RepID=A0A402CT10_9BACT|nr:DUF4291 domain-containing protein [Capsulimonas corticalis]BDI30906.1 hypothetical protein CCAX7_29570 [Capsulimonas corticalis]